MSGNPGMMMTQGMMMQQMGQQQQQPPTQAGPQQQQQQQQQQQNQLQQQQAQQAMQAAQRAAAQAEDPIVKIKELVPKLKQSLNTIMTKSSVALLNNASIDNMQNVEKEQGQTSLKAAHSSDVRQSLENAFEDFYHSADLLEAMIRLAQQQCLNTFSTVATIEPRQIHFSNRNANPQSNSVELSRYNEYIDIIKNQIQCANEATQILQKTYTELQSVDQNFQQHVRRNPSQQRSQSQSPAQN